MKIIGLLALSLISLLAAPLCAAPIVVSNEKMGQPADRNQWSQHPAAKIVPEGEKNQPVLRIEATPKIAGESGSVQQDVTGREIKLQSGRYEVQRTLRLQDLRGWRLELSARVRTLNVAMPDMPWEGLRFGVNYVNPNNSHNSAAYGVTRTGDPGWFDIKLQTRVPADATAASLYVGLAATTGILWVDTITVTKIEPPLATLAASQPAREWRTTARGMGVGNGATRDDAIYHLATDWKANSIKWWVEFPSPDLAEPAYFEALDKELAKWDSALAQAERAQIKLIMQGSFRKWFAAKNTGPSHRIFTDAAACERALKTWDTIAARYKGRPGVDGYDIHNEPVLRVQIAEGCYTWEDFVQHAAQRINAIDDRAKIYMQPEEWWGARSFEKLRPIQAKNVVYSVHMYEPFKLTHQGKPGVTSRNHEGIEYPGMIKGVMWDKNRLRAALQPVREFQLAYGVPIHVGEFSCIRWSPNGSAARWFKDCLDIFEEYGWDWTYHAEIEWDGWSCMLGDDPKNLKPVPNPAADVVKQFLMRNTANPSN